MSLAKPAAESHIANFSRLGSGWRPPEAASACGCFVPSGSTTPWSDSALSRPAYTAPGMCAWRYCSSPAAGFISSKLQSKTISRARASRRDLSSVAVISVVYIAVSSMVFGWGVGRRARAQRRGGDAADQDQPHAQPGHAGDPVVEQQHAEEGAED